MDAVFDGLVDPGVDGLLTSYSMALLTAAAQSFWTGYPAKPSLDGSLTRPLTPALTDPLTGLLMPRELP